VFGIDAWLTTLPPPAIFVVVGLVIMVESMGVPLPGEITLMSAALLAASSHGRVSVWGVAIGATAGAIIGDSIGYYIGHRGGRPLLDRLGRRFPRHFGPEEVARAERLFARWGVWAIFVGRFIALLRILAGPLAGALRVPYRKFLAANAAGGICWSFATTFAVYFAGSAAERYVKNSSWILLAVALVFGLITTVYLRRRAARADALLDDNDPNTNPTPAGEIASVTVHAARDPSAAALDSVRTAARRRKSKPGWRTPRHR
jgi:membrane protein DedA with SNARE-associated domain